MAEVMREDEDQGRNDVVSIQIPGVEAGENVSVQSYSSTSVY